MNAIEERITMLEYTNDSQAAAGQPEVVPPVAPRRRMHFGARALIALAVAVAVVGGVIVGSAVTAAALLPPAVAAATSAQTAQPSSVAGAVYRKVGPSVVEILVSGT